jgi:hypothetical protein
LSSKEGCGLPVCEDKFSTTSLSNSEELALLDEGTTPAPGSIIPEATHFLLFNGSVANKRERWWNERRGE